MAWKPHRAGTGQRGREGPNGRKGETTVSLEGTGRQKSAQAELPLQGRGEAPREKRSGEAKSAAQGPERLGLDTLQLMERIVEGGNLRRALKRVQQNEGSPGVDGLTVDEFPAYLRRHWA